MGVATRSVLRNTFQIAVLHVLGIYFTNAIFVVLGILFKVLYNIGPLSTSTLVIHLSFLLYVGLTIIP